MDSRVSKLANIVDDKTIIAQLIREKSDRIRLIEFKDARADIWQFFRLVCLDGLTLPYAVCVRCMKPVSYKAREGTGGLHRHPCSKQAIAAAIAAGIPFNTSANRSAKVNQMSRSTNSGNSSKSTVPTTASTSLVSIPNKMNTNFKPNFAFNSLAAIEIVNNLAKNSRNLAQDLIGSAFTQQSFESQTPLSLMSMNGQMEDNTVFSEELLILNILKLFCTELIPLEVLENDSFIKLVQLLISFGAINGAINLERIQVKNLLSNAYETSRLDFKTVLQKQSFITFVVDLWTQEITKRRFMTVWAHSANPQSSDLCKIVVTKDISHISSCDQLIKQLDFIRKDITEPNSEFIYLFDNEFVNFEIEANDNFIFCVNHQLNKILDEMNSIPDFCQMFNEIKMITNIMENIDGFGLKCVTQGISNFNNWFQILKIFKLLKEFPNLKQILSEQELRFVGKSCFDELTDFLVPFSEALHYFHFENDKSITTINLITLWRVKLENHCKYCENDSNLIKTVKERLRNALLKSDLSHPIFLMAVCFDPRFKRLKMFSEDMRTKTYDIIRRQMTHFLLKQEPQTQHFGSSDQTLSEVSSDLNSSNDSESQRKRFKAIEDKTAEAFNEYLDETNEEEKDELQRYLNLDVGQTQPLEFWCGEHSIRLPRLRCLAQRILSIPPVMSKCCHYSTSGEQLSIRRKTLDSRYLDKVLVLNSHFSSI